MAFRGKERTTQQDFESPEALYARGPLPRTEDAVPSLWLHQGDVIRAYAEDHQDTPDLALELPTGTGKTLPGLLIAEWVRRKKTGPVLYATPTKQLAAQVRATAEREGIPSSLLIGSAQDWNTVDESEVASGQAVGITTYNAIFNSSPKVPQPTLIIFDDAHAAEQFVGSKYAVTITRRQEEDSYFAVLDALSDFMTPLYKQRLEDDSDSAPQTQIRLILPIAKPETLPKLDKTLAELGEHRHEFSMIREGLECCCVYLSYHSIQIRPMIPPTFENTVYSNADQRIYLSATLGEGGEIERAFGRHTITRMPFPPQTAPRSGRRLFIFPDLANDSPPETVTREIISTTNKAIILSQRTVKQAEDDAATLASDNLTIFGRDELERDGLDSFANSDDGILALTNRYDGLDLPDDSCRIVVLSGTPSTVGMQETFLCERAGATTAIAERIRTRIVQGAGRCTRGPNDYAVVVIHGVDITRYFSRDDNRSSLEPELQAEVLFGWENSKNTPLVEIMDNIDIFLAHGQDWKHTGESMLSEFRESSVKTTSAAEICLGQSAPLEVKAWESACHGRWVEASKHLSDAAALLSHEAVRGYRGLLLYIAGVWLHYGADHESGRSRARELLRSASAANGARGNWLKEMTPSSGMRLESRDPADVVAIKAIHSRISSKARVNRLHSDLKKMVSALNQNESCQYEFGLTLLGNFLGAKAGKPKARGRCDSAWEWGTDLWVTVEAKSEQHGNGLLPLKDIRQANTQLDHLASDRGMDYPPPDSFSIIISDRLSVDPGDSRVANPNVFIASKQAVSEVAGDITAVWNELLSTFSSNQTEGSARSHIHSLLSDNGCLPSQVVDRLTLERIRSDG
ncbi:DEAD/DEAH box helicase [Brevibacterium luteolum]|uniref:DEAD/DEAH box helicase n=1 Tax=Brevibacterium luteolum TaxID=199591 RepID=A0A6G8KWU0_9MICO|nr:DEAD/DEAH box helicase [Brevibacterium luteolum]QIN29262.1 DEAD/DEAH box helicase [Brevibacterium luteolum]